LRDGLAANGATTTRQAHNSSLFSQAFFGSAQQKLAKSSFLSAYTFFADSVRRCFAVCGLTTWKGMGYEDTTYE
jgi:hypothetical protein